MLHTAWLALGGAWHHQTTSFHLCHMSMASANLCDKMAHHLVVSQAVGFFGFFFSFFFVLLFFFVCVFCLFVFFFVLFFTLLRLRLRLGSRYFTPTRICSNSISRGLARVTRSKRGRYDLCYEIVLINYR